MANTSANIPLKAEAIERYLAALCSRPVVLESIEPLGEGAGSAAALKAFGYGRPLRLTYRCGSELRQSVLRRVNRNGYGRERSDDRVAEVWLDFETFAHLPRHANAYDRVGLTGDGRLVSLGELDDMLLLTEYVPGYPYADDLLQLRDGSALSEVDLARAEALATYLAAIHTVKYDDPLLWRRRLRDLIGHGEGIMGLTDSYNLEGRNLSAAALPSREGDLPADWVTREALQAIESAANDWRWRLKPMARRLSQVHGDFHPFNILFACRRVRELPMEFRLIDRSRGMWGEPADDVSCLSINYLFFSLQRSGDLSGDFEALYRRFWQSYLAKSGDAEVLRVIAPWFAWRALVLASPQWYPSLTIDVRRKLLTFARRVMDGDEFDWERTNEYLEAD